MYVIEFKLFYELLKNCIIILYNFIGSYDPWFDIFCVSSNPQLDLNFNNLVTDKEGSEK